MNDKISLPTDAKERKATPPVRELLDHLSATLAEAACTLAVLQEELEAEGAPLARGARAEQALGGHWELIQENGKAGYRND